MSAAGALVVAQPDLEGGGTSAERDMCQLTTQQDRELAGEVLSDHAQAEVIELAQRGQIRGGEGSVVHVEVFWMASAGTCIIRGPRSLSSPVPRPPTYTLIREES